MNIVRERLSKEKISLKLQGTGGRHYIVYNKNQTNMEQEDDIT